MPILSRAIAIIPFLLASLGLPTDAAPGVEQKVPRAVARDRDHLPLEGEITEPDWISKPDADVASRYYPVLAQVMQIQGNAAIKCEVSASGTLEHCSVMNEKPIGLGFGLAALQMSGAFHMKPMTLDGAPVAGANVTIPLAFVPPPLPLTGDASAPAPNTPRSLELAQRIIGETANDQATREQFLRALTQRENFYDAEDGHAKEKQIAIDALQRSFDDQLQNSQKRRAAALAATLTEAQLSEVANFVESSAGKAWRSAEKQLAAQWIEYGQGFWSGLANEGRRQFCSRVACVEDKKPMVSTNGPAFAGDQ